MQVENALILIYIMVMGRPKGPKTVSITIRVPDELLQEIRDLALADYRSLNGQIVHLLEVALSERTQVFAKPDR